jgi:hypothetical protein
MLKQALKFELAKPTREQTCRFFILHWANWKFPRSGGKNENEFCANECDAVVAERARGVRDANPNARANGNIRADDRDAPYQPSRRGLASVLVARRQAIGLSQ